MQFTQYFRWFALAALVLLSLISCKKTEEEEDTPDSMSGTIVFDVPYYVLKGETVTMSASGIFFPQEPSYRWFISGVYTDSLSRRTVTVKFPDSIGVFTVTAQAFASDFYSSSTSQIVTTIDTAWGSSLTGLKRSENEIVDERDGHVYGYVTAGDLDWFSQNLSWQGAGVPFRSSPATASLFGSFYTWNEAMSGNVCPEGWRVPAQEDWESLATVLNGGVRLPFIDNWAGLGVKASADAYMNEDRMWPYSPDNTHTNDIGWNALPLGYTFTDTKDFSGLNSYGCWWSATEKDDAQAFYRYIWYDQGDFPMAYTNKDDMRACVRCVRTHQQSL